MKPVIDSHIHIDQYTERDRKAILHRLQRDRIERLIAVATDLHSAQRIKRLASTNSQVVPAYGFHPEQLLPSETELTELFHWIEKNIDDAAAIGEVGLPYYMKKNGDIKERDVARYEELLKQWIILAKRFHKPLNLHAVYEDAALVCDYLERHSFSLAHFHWFKADEKTIERLIANEFYISITPDITYKERTRKLVERYPLELMLVETDGPWPFAGPFHGTLTEPKMIHKTIKEIANIKRLPIQEVYATIYEATCQLYRFSMHERHDNELR